MLDAHCHVDLYPNPNQVALSAERQRVFTLAVTRLPSHFLEAQDNLRGYRYVRPALGFHPLLVAENFDEINDFENLIHLTRYIGEVGLDFSVRFGETKERQIEAFERILSLARGKDKILSIHSRRAEAEILKLLLQYDCHNAIFHWYTGPLGTLRRVVAHGFYLSINSQMLQTKSGRQIIEATPLDRILTETDGPFIKMNARAVLPADVAQTENGLAELWQIERQQVTEIIMSNFKRLLTAGTWKPRMSKDETSPSHIQTVLRSSVECVKE